MDTTQAKVPESGDTNRRATVLCSPARAGILTGQHDHLITAENQVSLAMARQ